MNKQITNCQMKSCNGLPCIIFNTMVLIIVHLVPLLYGCPISNEKVVLGSINEAVFLDEVDSLLVFYYLNASEIYLKLSPSAQDQ